MRLIDDHKLVVRGALLLVALVFVVQSAWSIMRPPRPLLTNWNPAAEASAAKIVGAAEPKAPQALDVAPVPADALEQYNAGSTLVDSSDGGLVRYYRRAVGGGTIAYFVVTLDERVHLELINADNAVPGNDPSGDTIWRDGGKHLATVAELAAAPYAARDGMELLGAMAFGFHGDERTSDEGTIVINGKVLRVNPGRSALCIKPDRQVTIGVLDAAAAAGCDQAMGAGPVVLKGGKIANTDGAISPEFMPYNPLNEDFVQIDWRRTVYNGTHPKTMIGAGRRADGTAYLVMLVSYGVRGVDAVRQLVALGCSDGLGGDDDSSTQAVWRGAPVGSTAVREVPDAIGVYLGR